MGIKQPSGTGGEGAADADGAPVALKLVVEGDGEVSVQREAPGEGRSLRLVRLFVGHCARGAVHDGLGQQTGLGEISQHVGRRDLTQGLSLALA